MFVCVCVSSVYSACTLNALINTTIFNTPIYHVKSVQIRIFSGLYSARVWEDTDQKKFRIWALFPQWLRKVWQMAVSFLNSICWLNDFYLKLKFSFLSKNLEIRGTRFYREKRRKSNSKRVGWFWCEIRCKVSSGKLIFALYDNLLISSFFLRLNIE